MTPERTANLGTALTGYSPPLLKPRSRLRWVLFVLFNLAAYTLACAFWQYLRTGRWLHLTAESFHEGLTTSMGQMLLEPMSIFTYPWMMGVHAVILALLIAVPLAVAVMYQLLLAILFVVLVGVVAHAPILALALALGCLIAARTRLRRNWPFWACILGLLPVVIYLYLLTYAGIDASLLLPIQRWLLAGPYLAALLLSALAAAAVVGMARLTKFQPGVIWPALVLLLAGGMGLFYLKVGPAELHYALLTRPLRTTGPLLAPVARDEFLQQQGRGLVGQRLHNRIQDDLHSQRDRLIDRCESFLRRFPDSPHAPAVAWIAARAESLQTDRADPDSPLITFTARYLLPASADAWRRLAEAWPDAEQAALARWHLARLELLNALAIDLASNLPPDQADRQRIQHVVQAERTLRQARDALAEAVRNQPPQDARRQQPLLNDPPDWPSPARYADALFELDQLLWTLQRNEALHNPTAARALLKLLAINPCQPDHAGRLRQLLDEPAVAQSPLADNIRLELAKTYSDPYQRARALIERADDELTDAAIEANYELGRLLLQSARAPGLSLIEGIKTPADCFRTVLAAPPSPWQQRAREHLDWLSESSTPDEP